MRALVTDVHLRNALAGIRGLGRAGIEVVAVGRSAGAGGRWSRYASVRAVAPDPVTDPGGFAAAVVRLAQEHQPLVLYPCQEESLDAIFAVQDELAGSCRLPWPGAGPVAALRDKHGLPALARAAGLLTPELFYDGPAGGLDAAALPLPALAKPPRKGGLLGHPHALHSRSDVEELLRSVPHDEPVLVQELAEGPLTAVTVLVAPDGTVAAHFRQEAIRTWPPGAGPSTLARSVAPDDELTGRCAELLRQSGYWGLAQLQFVGSRRGPALIDVNTRFYGSLALALASGVDFPARWHALASGSDPGPAPYYEVGVSYRWLEAEIIAALHGRPDIILRRPPRPRTGAMWAGDDPLPGVLMGARAAGVWLGRRIPLRRGGR
jgi:predicted ATP-grasp superfamily ATP-dependent carboligase